VYRRSHESGCTAVDQRISASPRATFCKNDIHEGYLAGHVFNMGRNMKQLRDPYRAVHKCRSFPRSCVSGRVVHEITMISQICSYKEPMEPVHIMQWHEHLQKFAQTNRYDNHVIQVAIFPGCTTSVTMLWWALLPSRTRDGRERTCPPYVTH